MTCDEKLVPNSGGHRGISIRSMGIHLLHRYPSKIHMYIYCNVGDRTRTGVFNVIWPYIDNTSLIYNVYKVYTLKTASTRSGEFFYEFRKFFLS